MLDFPASHLWLPKGQTSPVCATPVWPYLLPPVGSFPLQLPQKMDETWWVSQRWWGRAARHGDVMTPTNVIGLNWILMYMIVYSWEKKMMETCGCLTSGGLVFCQFGARNPWDGSNFRPIPQIWVFFWRRKACAFCLVKKTEVEKIRTCQVPHSFDEEKKSELMDQLDIIPLGTIKSSGRQSSWVEPHRIQWCPLRPQPGWENRGLWVSQISRQPLDDLNA